MTYDCFKKFSLFLTFLGMWILHSSLKPIKENHKTNPDAIVGYWLLGSGKTRLTIYNKNGAYEGKIVWLRKTEETNTKLLPAVGEIILSGLEFNAQEKKWDKGNYINPTNGKTQKCTIKLLNDKKLLVTTYRFLPLTGQTDTWYKVKKANPEEN